MSSHTIPKGPTGRDRENLYFTEEETESPRGGLESYDQTESRWQGEDANPVCLSPGQNPRHRSYQSSQCLIPSVFPDRGYHRLDHVTIVFMAAVFVLCLSH